MSDYLLGYDAYRTISNALHSALRGYVSIANHPRAPRKIRRKANENIPLINAAFTALYSLDDAQERLNAVYDNPELDGTDYAHPAWKRGDDHGALAVTRRLRKILDGESSQPFGQGEILAVSRMVLALRNGPRQQGQQPAPEPTP